ncbi:MAG: ketoacyl-ACP synthase III [Opitutales bacterium]|nr:ketoacyl-ACP synthase III [Opitutales bacterium]
MTNISIKGVGTYVPDRILTNDDLSKMVDTSDEWIVTRSGIRERHIARPDESTSDLCVKAAERAIKDANIDKNEIDLIIVGTSSPDMLTPSTAVIVQHKLGLRDIPAFDFGAACSGFQYGLDIARSMMVNPSYRTVLLICGDKLSSILDWEDRSTCVLFGDGAGAMILRKAEDSQSGIIDVIISSDGEYAPILNVPAGGSMEPASAATVQKRRHFLKMEGREVFKLAIQKMSDVIALILARNNLSIDQIDHVVPHQANVRIIDAIAEKLEIPRQKMRITVDKFGNTSASSILLAIDENRRNGTIKNGDVILTPGFGAGLTWGAAIIRLL